MYILSCMHNIPQIAWMSMVVNPYPDAKCIANIVAIVGIIKDEKVGISSC